MSNICLCMFHRGSKTQFVESPSEWDRVSGRFKCNETGPLEAAFSGQAAEGALAGEP